MPPQARADAPGLRALTARLGASPSPRVASLAVSAIFFVNGAAFANWIPRIPEVQAELGLSEAALGVALLGMAAGALLAMQTAGALVARFGSRAVVVVSTAAACAALPSARTATQAVQHGASAAARA